MKDKSISRILVLVKTSGRRRAMALLLGFTTLAMGLGGMGSSAKAQDESSRSSVRAQDGISAPIEGTWLTAITRINQTGADFTAVVSLTAGGVWLATGSNDRLNGGVSPLYGSWQRIQGNRYSSRAYFFAFDPGGSPVVMLRVDTIFKLKNQNQLEGRGLGYACSVQGNGQDCVRTPQVDITFTADRIVPPGQ